MKRTFTVAMILIFAVLSAVFAALSMYAPEYHTVALHVGNAVLFALCLGAYMLTTRKIAERPQAFINGVYSASLLRLMVCMGGMVAYVVLNKEKIHKPTVFALMGVYAVYTATETILLSRMARTKNK